jgi:tetratricopeptide (TPR) repeat protein
LQLENYGRVLEDCEEAIKLDPGNVKAYFRATKAAYELRKYEEALKYSELGLAKEPSNKTLEREKIKAENQIKALKEVEEKKKSLQTEEALKNRKFNKTLNDKGIVIGQLLFEVQKRETSKPYVDEENKIHWPIMFIYEEYTQIDFIEDFAEDHTLGEHLDVMFPPNEFADWDVYKKYTRESIEVYAVLNQVTPIDPSKKTDKRPRKVRIKETSNLLKVLQHQEYVVPGRPIFYVISANSTFKSKFLKMSIDNLMKL